MKRTSEVIRFIFTGVVCFLIEFVALVVLRDSVGLDTLIATPIAFLISVIVNYYLCVQWVFAGAKDQNNSAKIGFLVTSLMGLLLNEALMWIFGIVFGEDGVILKILTFSFTMYMMNKMFATLLVMIWNYFTKKYILQKWKKPSKQ